MRVENKSVDISLVPEATERMELKVQLEELLLNEKENKCITKVEF